MEQKICKNVIIPDPDKKPNKPLCPQSGLILKSNGNGSFVCPDECKALQEVYIKGTQAKPR